MHGWEDRNHSCENKFSRIRYTLRQTLLMGKGPPSLHTQYTQAPKSVPHPPPPTPRQPEPLYVYLLVTSQRPSLVEADTNLQRSFRLLVDVPLKCHCLLSWHCCFYLTLRDAICHIGLRKGYIYARPHPTAAWHLRHRTLQFLTCSLTAPPIPRH